MCENLECRGAYNLLSFTCTDPDRIAYDPDVRLLDSIRKALFTAGVHVVEYRKAIGSGS